MRAGRGVPVPFAVAVLLASAACAGEPTRPTLASFTLPLDSLTMVAGGTVRLYPVAIDGLTADTITVATTWASSAPEVATVDSEGTVTAGVVGRAVVTATAEGLVARLVVSVVTVRFASLATGVYHSCGLNSTGQGFCWGGDGGYGALGLGGPLNIPTPAGVAGGARFAQLSVGEKHTCGLTPDGAALCWGVNYLGQLGIGVTDHDVHPVPTPVAGGLQFKVIEAGWNHTCAIALAGDVYCWGAASHGEVGGSGGPLPVAAPGPTVLPGGLRFTALSAGDYYTCGLDESGAVYCWGLAGDGRMGATSLAQCTFVDLGPSCLTPIPLGDGRTYTALSAFSYHACALQVSGAPICWGNNSAAQLGRPDVYDHSPFEAGGGLTFSSITAGGGHTCGVAADGTYCWGSNEYGELGDRGRTLGAISPTPIAAHPELTFRNVWTGLHYTCGLTTSQVAYCWGINYSGQLGVAHGPNPQLVPARIAGQP